MIKRLMIPIFLVILSLGMIVAGIIYSNDKAKKNDDEIQSSQIMIEEFTKAINQTISQPHYQLMLNIDLKKIDATITGIYRFDINHENKNQRIEETIITKDGTTTSQYYVKEDNNTFYKDNSQEEIVLSEQANIEYLFKLMYEASDITENTFTLDASAMSAMLNETVIPELINISNNESIVIENPVVFNYQLENDTFKHLISSFVVNNEQRITLLYEISPLEKTST